MRSRLALLSAVLLCSTLVARPLQGQRVIDVTVDMLDRWLNGYDKEKSETKSVEPQLNELNAKISKWQSCKRDLELAGSLGKVAGIAARLLLKSKCGASSDADWIKDRQKILDGPENAGASLSGLKIADYRNLKEKLQAYMGGDREGFTKAGLDVLKSRDKQLASAFGASAVVASGGGMRGAPAVWSADYAWIYIGALFAMEYGTGATMFEGDYKSGEWTKWKVSTEDNSDAQTNERAFLGKPSDGGEWWRIKTVSGSDTISMEALFKTEGGSDVQQKLVRMRGKFPGNAEAQELLVPEQYSMWNMAGSLGRKPTKESLDGATVGTETVTTPAGTFKAKHVRFGTGAGTMDWWLDETAVGGWVKFVLFDQDKKPRYTMELVGKGTGAKSELGVTIK
jgi:hypothetical protein